MLDDVMIDLETLDVGESAVVTAIGAVSFEYNGSTLGERFYYVLTDWDEQQARGRTIRGETVKWWLKQGEEARKELYAPKDMVATTTATALTAFRNYVSDRNLILWGNGSDFDNVILGSLYGSYDLQKPWSHSRNRCYRTLKNMTNVHLDRVGTHHNALDDAVHQARHLQLILKDIRK